MSLKNFQDRNLAIKTINKINEYGESFIPDLFDVYEPVKRKYAPKNISDIIDLWINEEQNTLNAIDSYAAGHLIMKKKKGSKVSYQMNWEKDNKASFNFFVVSQDISFLKKEENFNSFMSFCKELTELLEPVRGDIANYTFPDSHEPIDLQIRHPEIQWMNFFGKPYIDLFGREKLLSAPCYKVELINDNVIALQATENVFEPIPNEVRTAIKKHLGENAFTWEGKRALVYKNKENIIPKFDFSEVLFDKTKPIVEPQVKIRHKS
jgi:hypothetical protein